MITRADYMNRDHPATFTDYYREVIAAAGLKPQFSASELAIFQEEFEGGNVHFNSLDSVLANRANRRDMQLSAWDIRASRVATSATIQTLKERGDHLSPAGKVCIIKELARMAVEEEKENV